MSALDTQIAGNHYAKHKIQPINYIMENNLNWIQGNVVKYVTRYLDKNGPQDLQKVIHYCAIELEKRYNIKSDINYSQVK